jgi:hypothetical protein
MTNEQGVPVSQIKPNRSDMQLASSGELEEPYFTPNPQMVMKTKENSWVRHPDFRP